MNTGTSSGWYEPRADMIKGGHALFVVRWTITSQPVPLMNKTSKRLVVSLTTWNVDASYEEHEEYVKGLMMKYEPRYFFLDIRFFASTEMMPFSLIKFLKIK